jgi:hypothetical protein
MTGFSDSNGQRLVASSATNIINATITLTLRAALADLDL